MCRVAELKSTLDELQKRLTSVTLRYNQVEGQYNSVVHECSNWSRNDEDVQKEIEEIKCLLEKLQKDLENETTEKERLRVRVATLKREITTLEEEHTQVHMKKWVSKGVYAHFRRCLTVTHGTLTKHFSVTAVLLYPSQALAVAVRAQSETEFPTVYESGLEEAIEELRVQNERECAQYKVELEYRYKDEVSQWLSRANPTGMVDTHSGCGTKFVKCFFS